MPEPLRFEIHPNVPYRLAASAEFFGNFVPARGTASSVTGDGDALDIVFLLDDGFEPVGVRLRQRDHIVEGELFGSSRVDAARAQVARMLSLDVDGSGWIDLGRREPVVGRLQQRYPGFVPVCFPSPYEAAFWGVLAQRVPMTMAARLKRRIAEAHGPRVTIGGREHAIVPTPETVLSLEAIDGLSEEKLARLSGIARAATEGQLDAGRLRGMPVDDALEALGSLGGVGPWTAGHILYRGAALEDALPAGEPRVLRAIAVAYGMKEPPSPDRLEEIAEAWRPYRMWVAISLVRSIRGTPHWRDQEGQRRGGRSGRKRNRAK